VYGVTVLTSLSETTVNAVYNDSVSTIVSNLFDLVALSDLDGVVCSPVEVAMLRDCAHCFVGRDLSSLKFVVPGIRPLDARTDDQARTATPGQAVKNGASLLVIGRPITQAADPLAAFEQIERSIEAAELDRTIDASFA